MSYQIYPQIAGLLLCNQCDYIISHASTLRKFSHIRFLILWVKQFEDAFDKIHSGEKSNNCNQCDYALYQADNLRGHLKMHECGSPELRKVCRDNSTPEQCEFFLYLVMRRQG